MTKLVSRSAALGAGVLLALTINPAHAADDLIDANPAEVYLDAPAPGEYQTWSTTVASTTDKSVSLDLEVTGSSAQLFSGEHQLRLTLIDGDGAVVINDQPVESVLDGNYPLEALEANQSREYEAFLALPIDAGNEYQDVDGHLRIRFVASADEHATPSKTFPDLPKAGAPAILGISALALGLFCLGIVALTRGRKKDNHA